MYNYIKLVNILYNYFIQINDYIEWNTWGIKTHYIDIYTKNIYNICIIKLSILLTQLLYWVYISYHIYNIY